MREICKSGLKRGAELTLRSYSTAICGSIVFAFGLQGASSLSLKNASAFAYFSGFETPGISK